MKNIKDYEKADLTIIKVFTGDVLGESQEPIEERSPVGGSIVGDSHYIGD